MIITGGLYVFLELLVMLLLGAAVKPANQLIV
jgi:hypothetical protein